MAIVRTAPPGSAFGIADISALTGLSIDTLRWYEREGILPAVTRDAAGRRRYTERERDLVLLLTALRDGGMSTAAMRQFVQLLGEGAASHGRRITLLEHSREDLVARRAELDRALGALDAKIDHYQALIDAGLDCDGAPVPEPSRAAQADRGLTR